MWRDTAKRYQSLPHLAAYHLMVEPDANSAVLNINAPAKFYPFYILKTEDWNFFLARLVEAVRTVDKNTPIWVSAMGHVSVDWVPFLKLPAAERLLLNVHFYEPYEYTHQVNAQATFDAAKLKERLGLVASFAKQKRVPWGVGEFGVKRTAPLAETYLEQVIEVFEFFGVNHAVWLWESAWKEITYDDFNFRRGTERGAKKDIPNNALVTVLRKAWQKNKVRPSSF